MEQFFAVNQWVRSLVVDKKLILSGNWEVVSLAGDASARRYYRVISQDQNFIVAASPVKVIDNTIFSTISKRWLAQGIRVPSVFFIDECKGFMLIEDFGNEHLFDKSQAASCVNWYKKAVQHLLLIQQLEKNDLPVFDREFLLREMMLFKTWFVEFQLKIESPNCLTNCFDVLIANGLNQPQVVMHRDYHSKNLLVHNNEIAVIDFQDAVIGPLAYDVVSLLKDCYLLLEEKELDLLIDYYLSMLETENLLPNPITRQGFVKWFDLIGLQRHLKVLGLFVRLSVEDGKTQYLYELPRVYNYVLTVSEKYEELNAFSCWLKETVSPLVINQPWYRN